MGFPRLSRALLRCRWCRLGGRLLLAWWGHAGSSLALGEVDHELCQRFDAGLGYCVVQRGANTADHAMPLQADQSIGSRLLEKVGFQHIVGKEERNVHARATGRSDAVAIETHGAGDYRVQAWRPARTGKASWRERGWR